MLIAYNIYLQFGHYVELTFLIIIYDVTMIYKRDCT